MVLAEAEPVGGFVGISVSEPLLQGGILFAVFGYMIYLQPLMAIFNLAVFSPQLVFVPLMQGAINRRALARIGTLRAIGIAIVSVPLGEKQSEGSQQARIESVFVLDMGIYKLKFSMNFLMNLLHHIGVAGVLGLGGWYVVSGTTEIGTVVAFLAGLAKINDPWRDLVS